VRQRDSDKTGIQRDSDKTGIQEEQSAKNHTVRKQRTNGRTQSADRQEGTRNQQELAAVSLKVRIKTKATFKHGAVRILVGATDFSFLQNVQTFSRAHPASNSMGTDLFPGGNVAGREVKHSPPSSA
jgi:hypothetical protein